MNKAYLGIGSNVDGAAEKIEQAVKLLSEIGFEVLAASETYVVTMPYYNKVVAVRSALDYEATVAAAKTIEKTMGRGPEMKALGMVPIDIDVVVFGGRIRRWRDYKAEYFTKGYKKVKKMAK